MRAVVLGLVLAMAHVPARAAAFADVPFDHWAYQAIEELAQEGLLDGYPDGLYRGPQPMTRYEFAVATLRAEEQLARRLGNGIQPGQAERGSRLAAEIARLLTEFAQEFAALTSDKGAVLRRLADTASLCDGPQFRFTTGVYWPVERLSWVAEKAGAADPWAFRTDLLKRLQDDYHCNAVWMVNGGTKHWQQLLPLAEQAGLKLWLTPEQAVWNRTQSKQDVIDQQMAAAVEALSPSPALGGLVLIDEARGPEMPQMERLRQALGDWAGRTAMVTMPRDTDEAAAQTGVPILCADPYPFFAPQSPNGPNTPQASQQYYRLVARRLAELAEEHGKTAWIMPQMFGDLWGPWHYDDDWTVVAEPGAYHHWRTPTEAEVRWQIWTAVAEGVRGVFFYVLFPPKNERAAGDPVTSKQTIGEGWPRVTEAFDTGQPRALLNPDGSGTPQSQQMADLYYLLRCHDRLLGEARPVDLVLAQADPPLTVRTLVAPDVLLAVVVNDDLDEAASGRVTFAMPTNRVEVIDPATGPKAQVPQVEDGGVMVHLKPGGGVILKLRPSRFTAVVTLRPTDDGWARQAVQSGVIPSLSGQSVTLRPPPADLLSSLEAVLPVGAGAQVTARQAAWGMGEVMRLEPAAGSPGAVVEIGVPPLSLLQVCGEQVTARFGGNDGPFGEPVTATATTVGIPIGTEHVRLEVAPDGWLEKITLVRMVR